MDAPPAGTVIAQRYQVTAPLPTTAPALAAQATRLGDGKPVLLKLLHPRSFGPVDPDAGRLAEKAEAFAHAGAVPMIDHGQTQEGFPFRVFEPPAGYTLSALLAHAGPLHEAVVADLALQLLAVLEVAHERGLPHGNLHPDNVLLVDAGPGSYRLSLMDFGMPRPKPQGLDGTEAEARMKDVSYAAPELLHGSPPGAQSDLYALGLLLAEALTSQTIVTAASNVAVTLLQASDKPVDLPATVLQSSLGPAIISATRKPLERRVQTASAMREQIARASVSRSVDVGQAMTGYMTAIPDMRAGPSVASMPHHPPAAPAPMAPPMQGHTVPGPSAYGSSPSGVHPPSAGPVAAHPSSIGAYPSVATHPHGPHAGSYLPPSGGYLGAPGQPRPSSRKKSSSGLAVLLVVGAVGLLVLGFGGVGLYLLVTGGGAKSSSSAPSDDDDRRIAGDGSLGEMSPNQLESLLTDDGWTLTGQSSSSNSTFALNSFTVQRDRDFGVVHLYRYDDVRLAKTVFDNMQKQTFGASARDGGTIVLVAIGGTSAAARRTSERVLDELVPR